MVARSSLLAIRTRVVSAQQPVATGDKRLLPRFERRGGLPMLVS